MSARLVPDEERWKSGCEGGAKDILDPDTDRTWLAVNGALC